MDSGGAGDDLSRDRLVSVEIDERSLGAASAEAEHECEVAIYDLLEENSFAVTGQDLGPYRLRLALEGARLMFAVKDEEGRDVVAHFLALGPFRKTVTDYVTICQRHYAAIRTASPSQIEAIDMGRRGLHNESATIVRERLAGKIEIDFATARRLFTLLVALNWDV
ncbi:UPF0262 family protein [Terrihabitans rhizophilus]|uniref:UPF0262 family protein n=1 Tax=Terrihabitans rhizophilus TaxID=3092662 RepID=UPI0029DE6643|nr:UPF0262 family protein [Terrihabitans sp. PJ23]